MFTAIASGGSSPGVTVNLPTIVGTDPLSPPAMSCYTIENPSFGFWFAVAGSDVFNGAPFCLLSFVQGAWRAHMLDMRAGWTAAFVVVF